MGFDAGELDKAVQDRLRDWRPGFEMDPSAGGDPKFVRQARATQFAISVKPDLMEASGQKLMPVH
jgi:hypothetical protein